MFIYRQLQNRKTHKETKCNAACLMCQSVMKHGWKTFGTTPFLGGNCSKYLKIWNYKISQRISFSFVIFLPGLFFFLFIRGILCIKFFRFPRVTLQLTVTLFSSESVITYFLIQCLKLVGQETKCFLPNFQVAFKQQK